MSGINLKPCPFCGGGAGYNKRKEWNCDSKGNAVTISARYKVACRVCGCGTAWLFYEEDAIDAWNRRADNDD